MAYIHLIIVGNGGCGKTSLISAYKGEGWSDTHEPTVFNNVSVDIFLNGKKVIER